MKILILSLTREGEKGRFSQARPSLEAQIFHRLIFFGGFFLRTCGNLLEGPGKIVYASLFPLVRNFLFDGPVS